MKRDFNNLRQWLEPQLEAKGLSVERFARLCKLSKAVIYFYMADINRPSVEAMARMCAVLGVHLKEGLEQYTPNLAGRPTGSGGTPRRLAVRR